MKTRLNLTETLSITSMLFGLFFGAGNLIFPAFMGQAAGRSVLPALLGFLMTGVGMPMLAVATLGITGSNGVLDLSEKISKPFGYFFTCALYLTIGPFFACPRCVTVPFEVGIRPLLPSGMNPQLALFIFSFAFFLATLWFSLRPSKILTWTGKILNPIFLVILGVLLITALLSPIGHIADFEPTEAYRSSTILHGFLDGYNTMDTLAGLAFGIIVVDVIKTLGISKPEHIAANTVRAGIFSCLLMGLIYFLVALAGAESRGYSEIYDNGGAVLAAISWHYFPGIGSVLLASIVLFACLKTVIGLVTSCSSTFEEMFPHGLKYRQLVILFSSIIFIISNVGLSSIIQISIPVLMMLYPLSITLIILMLAKHFFNVHKTVLRSVMTAVLISSVFDFCRAMPASWISFLHLEGMISFLEQYLPFFDSGFGWIAPSILGLIIGCVLYFFQNPMKNINAAYSKE